MEEKKYWRGLEELNNDPEFVKSQRKEFKEDIPVLNDISDALNVKATGRRDFLKFLGFSVSAATLAASCEMPVRKAIPYVIKPEEIVPGVANYYASTFMQGGDYCSILVKTREGRPIKIEGNELSPVTKGGTSARAQASVLSLYDNYRLNGPKANGENVSWDEIDNAITTELSGNIVILSSTIMSPSTKEAIKEFTAKYPGTRHVTYDAVSYAGMLNANQSAFGKRVLPSYHFEKAQVIVSLGADFLSTWISPVEYTKQYVQTRKIKDSRDPNMSKHYQIESHLSLTGSNADERVSVKPSEEGAVVLALYNALAGKAGSASAGGPATSADALIKKAADDLWKSRGKALVVSGSNDANVQVVVNRINELLNSYGNTIDMDTPSYQRQGSDKAVQQLVRDMKSGNVAALIVYDANPAYDLPNAAEFVEALSKVKTTISFNDRLDETTTLVKYACPDNHFLESWNDAEPKAGYYSLVQPAIAPLFDTRQAQDSLLKWAGSDLSYYDFIKQNWQNGLFGRQTKFGSFQKFWDQSVHDGVFMASSATSAMGVAVAEAANELESAGEPVNMSFDNAANALAGTRGGDGVELVLYEKVAMGSGQNANNPWLQETPDPITRIVWDNYALVSPKFAADNGLEQEDVISVSANGYVAELPVVILPGQPYGTIAVALGYGRERAGRGGDGVGQNAYPFISKETPTNLYYATGVTFEATGTKYPLAQTQTHHTLFDGLNNRKIVKETTLEEYKLNPAAGNLDREQIKAHLLTLYNRVGEDEDDHGHTAERVGEDSVEHADQQAVSPDPTKKYGAHEFPGHHWGMSIDLNSCIGCAACAVACVAENNVPVVGKEEVRRVHEMTWLRIDRYFSGDEENPEVVFQPMLCQHCDNAPCENVCPVAATTHSNEGLNQMAYNRCIGTRYCQNNCPYKVRRFNWYDFQGADSFTGIISNETEPFTGRNLQAESMLDDLTRMVLNPDVTVRSRGVMEKCSFCVQRIQEGKLTAKKEGRQLKESDVNTACQSACPADAISFGDRNNTETTVSHVFKDEPRAYGVIEEIHVLPSVAYLTKVRNKKPSSVEAGHTPHTTDEGHES